MLKQISLFLILFICFQEQALAVKTSAPRAILVDADSNEILFEKNSTKTMAPSSMSKLMTIYLVFERLKSGDLKLTDEFIVSKKSWEKQGTKMFLKPGQSVKVEDLLRGVIVQSGNDAAIALAEGVAGSEDVFVFRMNLKAKELGLKNSNFENATGWPHNNHKMTPEDLAILTQRIINDFPEYYHYFSEKEFAFNGIKQSNRNTLLKRNIGVDGLKTGNSSVGKYGIVVSGVKNGRRLILVVNGLNSESERAKESYKLLQYGFLNFSNVKVAKKNQPIVKDVAVWLGTPDKINLVAHQDVIFTVPVDQKEKVSVKVEYLNPLLPGMTSDQEVGKLMVTVPGEEKIRAITLYPNQNVEKAGFFSRIFSKVKFYLSHFTFTPPEQKLKTISLRG